MKDYIQNLLLLVVLGAAAHSIHAADIVWTNTAGGNWSVAANWNPNQTPDQADTAVITNNGNYTVIVDVSTTVGALVLGTTNGVSNPTLLINNGPFTLAGFLTNYGTVVWSNTDFYGQSSPQIFNYGLWDAKTGNTFAGGNNYSGDTTTFNNFGTFRKSGDSSSSYSGLDYKVVFNNSGTVDVQMGTLSIKGGAGGGVFHIAGGANLNFGGYTLAGGTSFTGSGLVAGNVTGSDAVLNGTATLTAFYLSGTMTIASNCVVILTNLYGSVDFNGILTNYGTVVWSGGDLQGYAAEIDNYGLWDAQTGNTFAGGNNYSGDTTTFNNFGTFRKSGDSSSSYSGLDYKVVFNNSGTVDVQMGTLSIKGGAGGGVFHIAGGANLNFGGYTLAGGTSFTGSGLVAGNVTGSDAVLNGTATLTAFYLSGTMTIASNCVVILTNLYGSVDFNGILTNYGTVVWSGGDLQGYAAEIDNYGLWDAQTGNTFAGGNNYSGDTTTFNNFGTFRKSGDSSSSYSGLDYKVVFNNSGTVDVQMGTLSIKGGAGGGVFHIAGGANLNFGGYTLAGGTSFTGSGLVAGNVTGSDAVLNGTATLTAFYLSGTMTIASNCVVILTNLYGSVDFNGILTNYGTVVWSGGDLQGYAAEIDNYGLWDAQTGNTFAGGNNYSGDTTTFNNFGTFRKSGDSSSSYSGLDYKVVFNNSGTVDVQMGTLSIDGSCALAGGALNFGINSPTDFGCIYLAGDAVITGTVSANLNNDYAPAAGASFPVLAYGSESGVFTTVKLPAGLAWQTNYGPTAFTLSVSVVLPAQLSVGRRGTNTISFAWNAVPGQTYQVQYKTNLVSPDWINLGDLITVTNGTMTASDIIKSDPQRFYRIVLVP